MRLKGRVVPGAMRGGMLIEKFYFRIKALLGFEPFKGTLNIKLEKPVEIEDFTTKTVDHILLDGRRMIEVYLAPAVLHVHAGGKMHDHESWAVRFAAPHQQKDLIEIIDKEKLEEKLNLKEGTELEITLFEQRKPEKGPPGMGLMRRIYGRESRLSI
ncbi:MAG: DUF120 domain-containing protein [Candidatus Aenigmarchaeota archaeon]|nr:DUF120 domain-containing protein [Candidatus Aenigmarchaeota archaeon]